jgi:hypothetical protein
MAMATGMPPLISNKNKIFNIGFLSDLEVRLNGQSFLTQDVATRCSRVANEFS